MLPRALLHFFEDQPKKTIVVVGALLILVAIPVTIISINQAREPRSRAAVNTFTITSVSQVAQEINPNASSVDVCGTDLGSMFDWNGKVYSLFGDTFGCPLSSSPPNWRNNTLAFTTDTNPADGISFDGWVVDGSARAKLLFAPDSGITAIPTYGVAVGSTGYAYYMQVNQWGPGQGVWSCDFSSVVKSTDGGQNWTKLTGSLKWNPGNFNQVAIYKNSGYNYFFGIPCGRLGGVKLMRVADGAIENKAAYQYLSNVDGNAVPTWITNNEAAATQIVTGPVGELSVRFNNYLNAFVMMYLKDVGTGQIELRTAPNLWGPWSSPQTVTTANSYPCLYAPYMREGYDSSNGQTMYFRMSRYCGGFNPYSTYWMKMTFLVNNPPAPAAPTVDIKANNSDGPITINSGSNITLTWTSTNATSCSASNGWSGSQVLNGSLAITNLTATKTYTLTCTGSGGISANSVIVNVNSASSSNNGGTTTGGASSGTGTNSSSSTSNNSGSSGSNTTSSTTSGSNSTNGKVTTPGQLIPNITIKVVDQDKKLVKNALVIIDKTVRTGSDGLAKFNLEPGQYTARIEYQNKVTTKTFSVIKNADPQVLGVVINRVNYLPYQAAFVILISLLLITIAFVIVQKFRAHQINV